MRRVPSTFSYFVFFFVLFWHPALATRRVPSTFSYFVFFLFYFDIMRWQWGECQVHFLISFSFCFVLTPCVGNEARAKYTLCLSISCFVYVAIALFLKLLTNQRTNTSCHILYNNIRWSMLHYSVDRIRKNRRKGANATFEKSTDGCRRCCFARHRFRCCRCCFYAAVSGIPWLLLSLLLLIVKQWCTCACEILPHEAQTKQYPENTKSVAITKGRCSNNLRNL